MITEKGMPSGGQGNWGLSFKEKAHLVNDLWWKLQVAIIMATLRNRGEEGAAALEFTLLREHQRSHFLEGLRKLGIDKEATDAIKAAKYHYFSNQLIGCDMQYVEETPEKVWIRYNYPIPYWPGVAVTALGPKYGFVGAGGGWHAHNGRILGNPRLGYVQTEVNILGDPADAGYFKIFDHDLEDEEIYQHSMGEEWPFSLFDPDKAPKLSPEEWPEERRLKAMLSYTLGYTDSAIMALINLYGVSEGCSIFEHGYKMWLMLERLNLMRGLNIQNTDAKAVATLLQRKRALLGEEVTIKEAPRGRYILRQSSRSKYFPNLYRYPVEVDEAILQGWRGLVRSINHELTVEMTSALTAGDPYYEWVIGPKRA